MQLPDLDTNRTADALFGDIMAYVDAANALVASRDTVMLAELDSAVEALCARIMSLDSVAAKEYAGKLDHLMAASMGYKEI